MFSAIFLKKKSSVKGKKLTKQHKSPKIYKDTFRVSKKNIKIHSENKLKDIMRNTHINMNFVTVK